MFEVIADPQRLAQAQDFICAGLRSQALVPVIDRVFAFEDFVAAHAYLESNAQLGKVVVAVAPSGDALS